MPSTNPDHPQRRAEHHHPWWRSDQWLPTPIRGPLRAFLQTEASSGVLLLVAVGIALVWVNSPWGSSYERFWHRVLTLRLGGTGVSTDLRHWVDEGLMTFFFLVVGLEIKRELVSGELRDRRAALLPIAAAFGGMVVPAIVYLACNAGDPGSRGWGIAMPTDIAFALGVLMLAIPRAPASLRVFLLSLAIVDDQLTVVVVAIFYSTGVSVGWLGAAALAAVAVLLLARLGVRTPVIPIVLGICMWFALREAGVSPTLAGVTMGLLTPAVPFRHVSAEGAAAVSPVTRLEALLHPWTSYLVVPLFALANAGVSLTAGAFGAPGAGRVGVGIVLARTLGKVLGIVTACWIAVRWRAGRLPRDVGWAHIVGVAAAAGVPFTVSLFIAEIALGEGALLPAAKLGILTAAALAGIAGFVLLRRAERGLAPGA
jgi:Na+:H+ antiporter, NhaA family